MKEKYLKILLIAGIGVLIALCVGGIIWAFLAGASRRVSQSDAQEKNIVFSDDGDPSKGPSSAHVVVHIYGDLQCSACRIADTGLQYAIRTYSDRVRFVWNDFPLISVHRNAINAANAARCAEEQGKFWQFEEMLFQKQPDWSGLTMPAFLFGTYATSLKMNTNKFADCYSKFLYQTKIQNDQSEGEKNNVQVTPTFFINNLRRTGSVPEKEWDRLLKSALSEI